MAVVHRIDRVLPRGVQLHLFGVKSAGIRTILSEGALDGRVKSIDSMAWDFTARIRFRTGRTVKRRARIMRAWHDRQVETAATAVASAQTSLFAGALRSIPSLAPLDDPALQEIAHLLADGEVDLVTAARLYEEAVICGAAPMPTLLRPAKNPAPAPRSQVELALAA
jgi:hypothetical protein